MAAFLADRMLEGLARRLRLAGYDVETPPDVCLTGLSVLERARAEGRVLLTTARRLAEEARPGEVVPLPEDNLSAQVRAVAEMYPIDFARQGFSRCSRDNTPLEEPPYEAVASALPPRVRQAGLRPVRRCPACGRLYWPGSHVARVRRCLAEWIGQDLGAA